MMQPLWKTVCQFLKKLNTEESKNGFIQIQINKDITDGKIEVKYEGSLIMKISMCVSILSFTLLMIYYLKTLEKNGYIESFNDEDLSNGKRRTYYRITEAGKLYYREKCAEWKLTKEVVEKFIDEEV